MQYHLNGFRTGDPSIADAASGVSERPDKVDVLIVGCGPTGLTLAAQLAQFPQITTRITERKSGPLQVGQADGIACRSIEMFEAFGFSEKVIKEGYQVNEVTFWRPDEAGQLRRADRIQDVEDDLSEMPHIILSQARVHDFFLEVMRNAPTRLEPDYDHHLLGVTRTDDPTHPVVARFKTPEGETKISARYVVGCDGARSVVRTSLGYELKGEAARQLWGVMDILAVTDFPDIRLKAAIQSADAGSILIIPREGGYMVRMYIELDALKGDERAADRNVSAEMLIAKAQAILSPCALDVKEVAWCSAYEIGQRVCDAFDDGSENPRIFIAGDACHTHSPKAGQGMNVSMADAFNLGWKLASVLDGKADPALLGTYSDERRAKAKELIDFDRDMARLFSAKPNEAEEAARFQRYFQKHGRYTAGVETRYDPSSVVGDTEHQRLATGLQVGMRFHSAPVIRLADAKPMQLGHVMKADGRWRIVLFAPEGDDGSAGGVLWGTCESLVAQVLALDTKTVAEVDGIFDLRAVFQQSHRDLQIERLPSALLPRKGKFGLTDYEKVFSADPKADIFDMRGVDRQRGAMLVVRPDQFIAQVLPLDSIHAVSEFVDQLMH